jgi:YD repeat-containing protein
MIKVSYPDKTNKILTYDTNKDWILSLKDREDCKETYNYNLSKDDPKNHYWSILEKKCDNKVVTKSRFEFWYKTDKLSGGKFLAKTAIEINGRKTEIAYHENFGRPLYIKEDGKTTAFTYYPDGLVESKKMDGVISSFKYDNKFRKVSSVQIKNDVTQFNYDEKGNLVHAKNTRGQYVKLIYDKNGRIASIGDQAKRIVNITYEDKFGKPRTVERPGVGTIEITYKPTGEIQSVSPQQGGPSVALQVASTFNNLLEIIAPAGVELGL